VIYLDFQKAFDKVPHKRLMLKINSLGISGSVFKWKENWLQDREQRVVMLGSSSRWIKVKSGVPHAPTRGHSLKLVKHGCNLDNRKFSFSRRVVNTWNSLSEDIVACDSINSFKAKLDKFLIC
jgi:hypothetical protein